MDFIGWIQSRAKLEGLMWRFKSSVITFRICKWLFFNYMIYLFLLLLLLALYVFQYTYTLYSCFTYDIFHFIFRFSYHRGFRYFPRVTLHIFLSVWKESQRNSLFFFRHKDEMTMSTWTWLRLNNPIFAESVRENNRIFIWVHFDVCTY